MLLQKRFLLKIGFMHPSLLFWGEIRNLKRLLRDNDLSKRIVVKFCSSLQLRITHLEVFS